jgi:hypothetical protein
MSSKLALLLKKKVPVSDHDDRNNDGPPSKRQRRPAARKLGAEAKQQQGRQQQQQQQQHKSAVHRGPAAGKAAAPQNGLDEDEEDDVSQPAAAEAYSQLVGLLSTQRTALGAALKQRQLQELEGASEDEEEESDENEEEGTQVATASHSALFCNAAATCVLRLAQLLGLCSCAQQAEVPRWLRCIPAGKRVLQVVICAQREHLMTVLLFCRG